MPAAPRSYDDAYWAFVGRFLAVWGKPTREPLRHQAHNLVTSLWPDKALLRCCEEFFAQARENGLAGDDLPGEFAEFGRALPRARFRDVHPDRIFLGLATRQWQIGRGKLLRRLLMEHQTTRERQRCGLVP